MKFAFVRESIMEDLCEGPFVEFKDEIEDEQTWDALVGRIRTFLLQFSHDEEAEGAPEGPGFLIQDIAQGSWTISAEFNDQKLLSKIVFEGIASLVATEAPLVNVNIIVTVYVEESMHFIIIRKGEILIPKINGLKRFFR